MGRTGRQPEDGGCAAFPSSSAKEIEKSRTLQKRKVAVTTAQRSAFAVGRRSPGIRPRDWPQWVRAAKEHFGLSDSEISKYLDCKFGYLASECKSILCPRCHFRRVRRLVETLYLGLDQPDVRQLLIEFEDRIEPFAKTQRLERKAHSKTPVNWQYYDRESFLSHLLDVAAYEQQKMRNNSYAVPLQPLGVLSYWAIWPSHCGWYITRARFSAFPWGQLSLPNESRRRGERLRRRRLLLAGSKMLPEELYYKLREILRQPSGLRLDDEQIIPAASLLLTTPISARKQHARGVFRDVPVSFPRTKDRPIVRRSPVEKLYNIGITIGSQQEFWLDTYVQVIQLFPEITFDIFCERLQAMAVVGPDNKPLYIPVEQKLKDRAPDAKQLERINFRCDYIDDRELLMSSPQRMHMPLDMFLQMHPIQAPTSLVVDSSLATDGMQTIARTAMMPPGSPPLALPTSRVGNPSS